MLSAALVLALGAPSVAVEPPDATIAGRGGRVEFVDGDGRVWIVSEGELRSTRGTAHLEVGAMARADVSWPGTGSARLAGPCVIEWEHPRDALRPGHAPRALVLRVHEFSSAEIELRTSLSEFELPGGWRISGERVAFALLAQGGSAVRVELRAGRELAVDGPRDAVPPWPRVTLRPGGSIALDGVRPSPRRVERGPTAPPWREVVWPWSKSATATGAVSITVHAPIAGETAIGHPAQARGTRSIETSIDTAIGPVRVGSDPSARVLELVAAATLAEGNPPVVRPASAPEGGVECDPATAVTRGDPAHPKPVLRVQSDGPEAALPKPSRAVPPVGAPHLEHQASTSAEPPVGARSEPSEGVALAPAVEARFALPGHPAFEAAGAPDSASIELEPLEDQPPAERDLDATTVAHDPLHWRGLSATALERHGLWSFERTPDLVVTVSATGRVRATLGWHAAAPAWGLGPSIDVELHPGATVLVDDRGVLAGHLGSIRAYAAPEDRPKLTQDR